MHDDDRKGLISMNGRHFKQNYNLQNVIGVRDACGLKYLIPNISEKESEVLNVDFS